MKITHILSDHDLEALMKIWLNEDCSLEYVRNRKVHKIKTFNNFIDFLDKYSKGEMLGVTRIEGWDSTYMSAVRRLLRKESGNEPDKQLTILSYIEENGFIKSYNANTVSSITVHYDHSILTRIKSFNTRSVIAKLFTSIGVDQFEYVK